MKYSMFHLSKTFKRDLRPKNKKRKKRKTFAFDDVVTEVRTDGFTGLTNDLDARMRQRPTSK